VGTELIERRTGIAAVNARLHPQALAEAVLAATGVAA
jgi:hypothetical protein